MPTIQPPKANQVDRLGETPAEARERMSSGGGETVTRAPLGQEVEQLTPSHIAKIREADEGFSGGPASGGTVEDAEELTEPPTPSKAMDMIRQLSQDKRQLETERDAAINKVQRYEAKYGELD